MFLMDIDKWKLHKLKHLLMFESHFDLVEAGSINWWKYSSVKRNTKEV